MSTQNQSHATASVNMCAASVWSGFVNSTIEGREVLEPLLLGIADSSLIDLDLPAATKWHARIQLYRSADFNLRLSVTCTGGHDRCDIELTSDDEGQTWTQLSGHDEVTAISVAMSTLVADVNTTAQLIETEAETPHGQGHEDVRVGCPLLAASPVWHFDTSDVRRDNSFPRLASRKFSSN